MSGIGMCMILAMRGCVPCRNLRSTPRCFHIHDAPLLYPHAMTGSPGQDEAPIIRFKRRKVTHPKRAPIDDNAREDTIENVPATQSPSQNHVDDDESALNLREALRNRKRPRERVKEVARKPDPAENEVVVQDAPQQHPYTSRFIAQTGQVVDRDDKQM